MLTPCSSTSARTLPADGQTGSGKTYTMLGAGDVAEAGAGGRGDVQRGLIQRVFEHLFARMAQGGGKHLLECSFLEIYNEVGRCGAVLCCAVLCWELGAHGAWQASRPAGSVTQPLARHLPQAISLHILLLPQTITDLLDPSRTNLQVRENLEGQYVSNLTAHEVYRGTSLCSPGERRQADPGAHACRAPPRSRCTTQHVPSAASVPAGLLFTWQSAPTLAGHSLQWRMWLLCCAWGRPIGEWAKPT